MANNDSNFFSAVKATVNDETEKQIVYVNDKKSVKAIKYNGSTYYPNEGIVDLQADSVDLLKAFNYLTKKVVNYEDVVDITELDETKIVAVKEGDETYNEDVITSSNYGPTYSLFFCKKDSNGDLQLHRLTAPLPKTEREDINFFSTSFNNYPKYLTWDDFVNGFNNNLDSIKLKRDNSTSTLNAYRVDYLINGDYVDGKTNFAAYIVYLEGTTYHKVSVERQPEESGITYSFVEELSSIDTSTATSDEKLTFARSIDKGYRN